MVTGKEAWADIQRMKHAAGQPPGMLSSHHHCSLSPSLSLSSWVPASGANIKEVMSPLSGFSYRTKKK